MTTAEQRMIAEQALQVQRLEMENTDLKRRLREIAKIITGVGCPLNDDIRGYSDKQLIPFVQILALAELRHAPALVIRDRTISGIGRLAAVDSGERPSSLTGEPGSTLHR